MRSFIHKSNPKYNSTLKINADAKTIDNLQNTIQIIPVNLKRRAGERSVIPRFINVSFDLEICQNIFDGNNIYIKNLNKLIYKYDFIKVNTMFTLAYYPGMYDPPFYDYKRKVTMKRMDKYNARGFNIQLHPQHDEMYNNINKLFNKKINRRKIIKFVDDGTIDMSIYDNN